jgi:hypothetical protein
MEYTMNCGAKLKLTQNCIYGYRVKVTGRPWEVGASVTAEPDGSVTLDMYICKESVLQLKQILQELNTQETPCQEN